MPYSISEKKSALFATILVKRGTYHRRSEGAAPNHTLDNTRGDYYSAKAAHYWVDEHPTTSDPHNYNPHG